MRGHPRHRIFVRLIRGTAAEDIHLRIVCHHTLVHAIEGQSLSVRTPERTFIDTKLIAMNTLSINDLTTSIGGELALLLVGIHHEQLMLIDISCGLRDAVPVIRRLSCDTVLPDDLLLLKIHKDHRPSVTHLNDRLVWVGERGIHQVTHKFIVVTTCPLIDFIKGEELFLLAGFGINGITLLHIGLYQLVTPPCQPHVLGLHVTIIRTSEIQVLEGEKLILRCHGR